MRELDKVQEKVYHFTNELSLKERELINLVRSIDTGKITCCKEKGTITHFKTEQTKLA